MKTLDYWMGLTDLRSEGTWRWEETHEEAIDGNWALGEPDNGAGSVEQDCAIKSFGSGANGHWNDIDCNIRTLNNFNVDIHALCQK